MAIITMSGMRLSLSAPSKEEEEVDVVSSLGGEERGEFRLINAGAPRLVGGWEERGGGGGGKKKPPPPQPSTKRLRKGEEEKRKEMESPQLSLSTSVSVVHGTLS